MEYPGVVPERFANPFPLFNLANDPTESFDRSKEHPEIVTKLKAQYKRFVSSMPKLNGE
jgi:hypothetical protein